MPGSRWVSGRIALKTCVTVRTPRSKAACASAAVAFEWPSETTIPRAWSASTSSSAPGSSGASVIIRTGPAASEPLEQGRVGIAAIAGGVGAEPARREERAFEVRTEDARASQRTPLAAPRAAR